MNSNTNEAGSPASAQSSFQTSFLTPRTATNELAAPLSKPHIVRFSTHEAQQLLAALQVAIEKRVGTIEVEVYEFLEEKLNEANAQAVWLREDVRLELHSDVEVTTLNSLMAAHRSK